MMGIDQHRGEKSSYNRGEYSDTLLDNCDLAHVGASQSFICYIAKSSNCRWRCRAFSVSPKNTKKKGPKLVTWSRSSHQLPRPPDCQAVGSEDYHSLPIRV